MKRPQNIVYQSFLQCREKNEKVVAWLIDPDRYCRTTLLSLKQKDLLPQIILVGGSLVSSDTDAVVRDIKSEVSTNTHVILFPGDYSQLSPSADALLLLSLVSGRNPEYLIGQQVKAAPLIRRMGMETISTAYMLIDGGTRTSVEYVSSTSPLPANKPELAMATAMAAEQLGMDAIYLEAGSGAVTPVSNEIISGVKSVTDIPLIVGGGLRSTDEVKRVFSAGADIAVVGTLIEKFPDSAADIMKCGNR